MSPPTPAADAKNRSRLHQISAPRSRTLPVRFAHFDDVYHKMPRTLARGVLRDDTPAACKVRQRLGLRLVRPWQGVADKAA